MSVLTDLQDIYDRYQELTPALVLKEASSPDHPLHRRFTWDDSEAAERWRLHQAQVLIRSVNVVIEKSADMPPIKVRAFVSKTEIHYGMDADASEIAGEYMPVEEVVANDVLRTAWFQSLKRDWERLKAKAGASQEFAQMVVADMRELAS